MLCVLGLVDINLNKIVIVIIFLLAFLIRLYITNIYITYNALFLTLINTLRYSLLYFAVSNKPINSICHEQH